MTTSTASSNAPLKEMMHPLTSETNITSNSFDSIYEDESQTFTLFLVQSKVTGGWGYAFIPELNNHTTVASKNTSFERPYSIKQKLPSNVQGNYLSFGEVKKPEIIEQTRSPQKEAIIKIKEFSQLSDETIADFIGVSRSAIDKWKKNGSIRKKKLQKLLAVKEILERAYTFYNSKEKLATWLYTPRGKEGYTPAALIEEGKLDLARLYAESYRSQNLETIPTWVHEPNTRGGKVIVEKDEAVPPHIVDDLIPLEEDED